MEVRVYHIFLILTLAPFVARMHSCHGCEDVKESNARHPEHRLKHERIRAIKHEILRKLGMHSKPNTTLANVTLGEKRRMLRVYEQSLQENNQVHDLYPEDNFYPKRFYSFIDTGITPAHVKRDDWSDESSQRFYFKLDIPSPTQPHHKLRVHSAKLKLYKQGIRADYTPNSLDGRVRVDVYLLLEPVRTGKETVRRLLDTQILSLSESGWDTFSIAEGVETWLARPHNNHGVEVVIFTSDEKLLQRELYTKGRDAEPENEISQEEDRSPVLNLQVEEVPSLLRTRRNAHDEGDCASHQEAGDVGNKFNCCRSSLYVSFKEIGWDDWIVAPPGYNAYYCNGMCPHGYRPANTHTLIKSAMHHINSDLWPKPCCTPKVLSGLTLLHLDDSTPPKLTVTSFNDMVVDKCACS